MLINAPGIKLGYICHPFGKEYVKFVKPTQMWLKYPKTHKCSTFKVCLSCLFNDISVYRRVWPTRPTRGAHQFSPQRVELKPAVGHRRIAVVKYSSSVPGGTLFLSTDRPLLLWAGSRGEQGTVLIALNVLQCQFLGCFRFCNFFPPWPLRWWGHVTTELQRGYPGGKVGFGFECTHSSLPPPLLPLPAHFGLSPSLLQDKCCCLDLDYWLYLILTHYETILYHRKRMHNT